MVPYGQDSLVVEIYYATGLMATLVAGRTDAGKIMPSERGSAGKHG